MIVARHAAVRSARAGTRAGFTLMEVMVVAAILVILAGVGSYALFSYLDDAKERAARANIAKIETAVMNYKLTHGNFPDNIEILTQQQGSKAAYLERTDLIDPWEHPYVYNPADLSATGKPLITAQSPSGTVISNR